VHDLNSGYAAAFNRRHERPGPLLRGRFKAILAEREAHGWEFSRYVRLNPVRAGLAARPERYPVEQLTREPGLAEKVRQCECALAKKEKSKT